MLKLNSFFISALVLLAVNISTANAQGTGEPPRDSFYDNVSMSQREVVPYDHIRQADVFFHKRVWRVIDINEKLNLPFRYEGIDWRDLSPLIKILREAAVKGEITVYNEDNFKTVMTPEAVDAYGAGIDTTQLTDLDGNYIGDTVIHNEFDPSRVTRYRIKEDWFFDEETSTMQVRIMGIAPIYTDPDLGDSPMFWCYYPTLREVLIKQEVFNPVNDAMRLTWDDIFEMRMFSSYVIKESNVFDRSIKDYSSGIDALMESEKVKNDLFEFEHDLWSF